MGGSAKAGGVGQTYYYYGTMAAAMGIGLANDLISIVLNGQEAWPQGLPWAVGMAITAGTIYVYDAQTWTCTTNHTASSANAPGSGLEGWTEYTFARTTEDSDDFTLYSNTGQLYGTLTFYWGTSTQTVDGYLTSAENDGGVAGNLGSGDQHPNYAGLVYAVIKDFLLGQEIQSGPNLEIVARRQPVQTIITGGAAGITDGQANLAAVAAELLTNENCLSLDSSALDATTFQAAADYLQTNQALYGASVLIDSSESITSLFDKLTQMIDGYIRFNPSTQLIEMGVYQHGVTPTAGTYVTITDDSLTKFPKFTVKSWQETFSRATVRYYDRQLNYQQTSVQVDDPRAFFVLGTVREQAIERPWLVRQAQAILQGREFLRVAGHAQTTGEIEVRREIGRTIRAGDYVLVDVDLEPNANSIYQFFRVTKRKIPPTGPITLEIFADNTLAPIPWNNAQTPVTVSAPAVPAITSFRFIEVPTVLSGQRGAIICLAQRPSNLLVGADVYFDTDSAGTFSQNLGIFSNYAAKATLYADLAATDTTLQLTVDTTQVDADYFTQEYATSQQQNDTMLAFIVSTVASGMDAGQIAESSGYQIMEILSVGSSTLISAGQYNLSVLRGRKNTAATAFTTANTEVWLIPANLLVFFNHAQFDTIRANRLAGLTPDHAQFRICAYTFVKQYALSDAISEPFRFPLKSISAPTLTLTNPASYSLTETPSSYPLRLQVAGTWSDPDNNLVEVKVLLRLATDTADRLISDITFAPTGSYTFSTAVQIDAPGTWTIKLIARDGTNLTTENDVTVTVTGAGAQCALVDIFDADGNQLLSPDNSIESLTSFGGWPTPKWGITPLRYIPYGALTLKCSTPGATIFFNTGGLVQNGNQVTTLQPTGYGSQYNLGTLVPFHAPQEVINTANNSSQVVAYYTIAVWATAPGYANGDATEFLIPLLLPLPSNAKLS